MRSYVPQHGEKGKRQVRARLTKPCGAGRSATRQTRRHFPKLLRKAPHKKLSGVAGGSGGSGGSGKHRPTGLRSGSGGCGWQGRGSATWQRAEVSAASLDQRGAMSTHALLRRSPIPCQASGTLSLEKDHHSDGACSSLLGPLRTHAIQGGRDMTVHGRQQPDQVASSERGRGRGVSKTTVFRDTPSVHHIRQHECLAEAFCTLGRRVSASLPSKKIVDIVLSVVYSSRGRTLVVHQCRWRMPQQAGRRHRRS
jgi:hypothetical protein